MKMSDESNTRLLYEWNAKYAQLDFAIRQAEHQLASVNKRLKSLWHDLVVYSAMIMLPLLLNQFVGLFINSRSLIQPFWVIFYYTLKCIYILFLPATIYYLAKTIYIISKNREQETAFDQPLLKGELHGTQPPREHSYRIEQKKLIYILSRYYLNQDIMNQLRKQICDSSEITLAELKLEMDRLPFFEEIRPADAFTDMANKKNRDFPSFLVIIGVFAVLFILLKVWGM